MKDIVGTTQYGDKVKYTLLVENIPSKLHEIEKKVLDFFDGATFYFGTGIFQGTKEKNLTIVIIARKGEENLFMAMAEELRALLSQIEVWVIVEPIELTILSIPEGARKSKTEMPVLDKFID